MSISGTKLDNTPRIQPPEMKAEAAMQSRDSCQQARGHAMWQTGPHRVGLGPTPMWQMDHTGLLSRGHDSRRSLRGHMSQCATQTQRPLLWLKKKKRLCPVFTHPTFHVIKITFAAQTTQRGTCSCEIRWSAHASCHPETHREQSTELSSSGSDTDHQENHLPDGTWPRKNHSNIKRYAPTRGGGPGSRQTRLCQQNPRLSTPDLCFPSLLLRHTPCA